MLACSVNNTVKWPIKFEDARRFRNYFFQKNPSNNLINGNRISQVWRDNSKFVLLCKVQTGWQQGHSTNPWTKGVYGISLISLNAPAITPSSSHRREMLLCASLGNYRPRGDDQRRHFTIIPIRTYSQNKSMAPVSTPTAWMSSAVTTPNGGIRICVDPKYLNKAIQPEHYPRLQEVKVYPERVLAYRTNSHSCITKFNAQFCR